MIKGVGRARCIVAAARRDVHLNDLPMCWVHRNARSCRESEQTWVLTLPVRGVVVKVVVACTNREPERKFNHAAVAEGPKRRGHHSAPLGFVVSVRQRSAGDCELPEHKAVPDCNGFHCKEFLPEWRRC